MDSKNQNKYFEYNSEIKYNYSIFTLNLNLEKNGNFKISLIYAKEIEYSSFTLFS